MPADFRFRCCSRPTPDRKFKFHLKCAAIPWRLAIDGPAGARVLPSVPLVSAAPAIQLDPRDGAPLLLDADNGVLLDAMHPAHSHARIQILATGLGQVQPAWPTGLPAPADIPHTVAAPVRALLDRAPVQVTRAILCARLRGHVSGRNRDPQYRQLRARRAVHRSGWPAEQSRQGIY